MSDTIVFWLDRLGVHMDRFTHYRGWSIDATPIMAGKLFRASAVVERLIDGERFIFSDPGDRQTRGAAQVRAIEWTTRWIDNNYRNEPVHTNGAQRGAAGSAS